VTDRLFQLAYICAYQMMRVYWRIRRPERHGALVALWHQGRVLLIRNSYVRYYSLPGGYVRAGETGRQAAARELREEVAINVEPEALVSGLDLHHDWEGKRERVEIFDLEVTSEPNFKIDNREVIGASWFTPEEALKRNLFPGLRRHLETRTAKTDTSGGEPVIAAG
jgi:8-oxo-dGTP diphosphatase